MVTKNGTPIVFRFSNILFTYTFINSCAKRIAQTQSKTLNTAYKIANTILPPWKSDTVSCEKVENVVKPPQKPVLSIKIYFSFISIFFKDSATITPIKNAPSTFVIKVLYGKEFCSPNGIRDIKYLKIEPKKPPIPTIKQLIIAYPPARLYSNNPAIHLALIYQVPLCPLTDYQFQGFRT